MPTFTLALLSLVYYVSQFCPSMKSIAVTIDKGHQCQDDPRINDIYHLKVSVPYLKVDLESMFVVIR